MEFDIAVCTSVKRYATFCEDMTRNVSFFVASSFYFVEFVRADGVGEGKQRPCFGQTEKDRYPMLSLICDTRNLTEDHGEREGEK